ncbi:K(+)/H(+) antiporter 1 [Vanrija pseudolonga]|uniref:K(+)/H(+) antiporter 1 n=1 Tax=Vanrija pseudolonga TaxID=143232 RepID=A0AAF0Y236_9TREE|nr:K(+)/H(+) antiporter 1 [Vanrija pseudolonga]
MSSIVNGVRRLVARAGINSSVITGLDPTHVDPTNPITLFIIQLVIIIVFTQALGWVFKYINQPKVIAEVIGGIILGPTAFDHIPGFTQHIFPKDSIPYLNLLSNVGLVLFLFVIGLEVDIGVAKRNGRASALISVAGMVVPFGLGAAVGVPVYHKFVDTEKVPFSHFILFICVSMAITAFPVLCRILTATKLLDTKVGVIVLSAGVGNDVVGWVLLALTLALTSSGKGIVALYILLAAVGWSIVLLWPIRKGFVYLARRSGSIENGPTPGMMTLTFLVVFASAFVTGILGVHPIFGGFLAGLIIPHEGGFAIAITEKIEDLVTMLFLPIYFVLSGLQTNLGALDTGIIWGYIILLCVVAFAGKFFGCAGVAKFCGYTWRESGAIGMLMSCKGLVELIVLNVGKQAGIIDERLFSMLVVVALVLTFITTPGTLWIYPYKYHTRGSAEYEDSKNKEKRNKSAREQFLQGAAGGAAGGREFTTRLLVVLQKLEHLAAAMLITQLLEPTTDGTVRNRLSHLENPVESKSTEDLPSYPSSSDEEGQTPVHVDALKLVELTGRTFSVMQSAEKDHLLKSDDALQLYRQFGRLRGIDVTPHITIVGQESYPQAVAEYAQDLSSQLIVVPWTIPSEPIAVEAEEGKTGVTAAVSAFDGIFGSDGSPMYTHFIRNLLNKSTTDVSIFIDRGFSGSTVPGAGQHVFLPFFGGPDDRLALRLVVQLCHHTNVTATVVRISVPDHDNESDEGTVDEHEAHNTLSESAKAHQAAFASNQLTIGGPKSDAQSKVVSDTADNIAWQYYTTADGAAAASALARVNFVAHTSAQPLKDAVAAAENAVTGSQGQRLWRPLLVVTGRGRSRAALNHDRELATLLAERGQNPTIAAELRKTVGDSTTALLLASSQTSEASFLVCEAGQ